MTKLYQEKHRPQFHFSPKEKWMNDPNGMVFYNGEYHLFYQYHPHGTTWGPMHWGHAVSGDLIHWEQLPVALYPDEHGAIFSGSAVVDWNDSSGFFNGESGLVAIYTSADSYPDSERPRQRQSLAYSRDNGRTWTKYKGNPVLSNEEITDYRDPKVFWFESSRKWVMVLAAGQSIRIYTSTNLREWEFASEFGNGEGSHDGVWECPDLFQLPVDGDEKDQRWIMIVSIGDHPAFEEGSRTQYFIGDFDGKHFISECPQKKALWLDNGRDNYAGVSWSDIPVENGRRIYIGWMSNWRYANQVPTREWRSAMTLPRELFLTRESDGLCLRQLPVSEISTIRKNEAVFKDLIIEEGGPIDIRLNSRLLEIKMCFEPMDAFLFGMRCIHSTGESLVTTYDVKDKKFSLDRTQAGDSSFSESFAAVQNAQVDLVNGKLILHLFIDTSSIEVFINEGKSAFTSLYFPEGPPLGIELFAEGGNAVVHELSICELKSIWE
ncbi:glycoside hydrolase family 32 protein [Peribacillus sp. SCS-26]|uniref:glycoside hydrolase family 32 protein n=1 Tax=Paraperibacillus marinus TaxID=3115295 RepID=UPI003906446F